MTTEQTLERALRPMALPSTQSSSLIVSEPQPIATDLVAQDLILGFAVLDHAVLILVEYGIRASEV